MTFGTDCRVINARDVDDRDPRNDGINRQPWLKFAIFDDGLPTDLRNLLTDLYGLSNEHTSFFIYDLNNVPASNFLGTLSNMNFKDTPKDLAAALALVRNEITKPEHGIIALLEAPPHLNDKKGIDAFLESIAVFPITTNAPGGNGRKANHINVFATADITSSPAGFLSLRRAIEKIVIRTNDRGTGAFRHVSTQRNNGLHPFNCMGCGACDHPTPNCSHPSRPSWFGKLPTPSQNTSDTNAQESPSALSEYDRETIVSAQAPTHFTGGRGRGGRGRRGRGRGGYPVRGPARGRDNTV